MRSANMGGESLREFVCASLPVMCCVTSCVSHLLNLRQPHRHTCTHTYTHNTHDYMYTHAEIYMYMYIHTNVMAHLGDLTNLIFCARRLLINCDRRTHAPLRVCENNIMHAQMYTHRCMLIKNATEAFKRPCMCDKCRHVMYSHLQTC